MSVFRVNRNKNYTTMSNYHLKDKNISLKAKGLLSTMLSLPDNWGYSIEGLASISKESSKSIKIILDELKEFGYLIITKLLPNETKTGRIEYIYDIYEIPKTRVPKQGGCFQPLENKGVVLGDYKILKQNTKEINTNNKKENIINYSLDQEEIMDILDLKKENKQNKKIELLNNKNENMINEEITKFFLNKSLLQDLHEKEIELKKAYVEYYSKLSETINNNYLVGMIENSNNINKNQFKELKNEKNNDYLIHKQTNTINDINIICLNNNNNNNNYLNFNDEPKSQPF